MILSAQSIRYRAGMITPFCERGCTDRGLSYGLGPAGYDVRADQHLEVFPDDFVILASTIEAFHIPSDIQAVVHDKSTWVRQGMSVFNTVFDPGFRGFGTIEILHRGRDVLHIYRGDPIAQLVFHTLDEPTEHPYDGKYQDQESGPQGAR